MRYAVLLTVFSACSSIPRPDSNIGIINAGAGTISGYNLKNDYDSNGQLLPAAKPWIRTISTLQDLDKNACVDPQSLANLKAYVQDLKDYYEGENQ